MSAFQRFWYNECHPVARLIFLAGVTTLALVARDVTLVLVLMLANGILIRMLSGSSQPLRRAGSLLKWLVLPTLLLHASFAPGERLFPGTPIPLSLEGVHSGLWLSLRLALFFLTAMLLSRCLNIHELQYYLVRLPWAGRRLCSLLLLLRPYRHAFTQRLADAKKIWRLRMDVRRVGSAILALMVEASMMSDTFARLLWLRWPASFTADALIPAWGMSPGLNLSMTTLGLLGVSALWW